MRQWIVNKLTSHRAQGGAHLLARSACDEDGEVHNNTSCRRVLYVAPDQYKTKGVLPHSRQLLGHVRCNVIDAAWRQERILHVGAARDRLLIAAELMELKKEYKDGTLREISLEDIEEFVGGG